MNRRLLFVLLLAARAAVAAASPRRDIDDAARAIYADFMSPYCPGMLLADCRSPGAVALRREIRGQLAAGVAERDVRQRLEARFREKLLAAPPARGFGLVAWLVPFVVIGAGLSGVLLWMRARRSVSVVRPSAPAVVDPIVQARFEDELRDFGRSA